MVDGQLTNGILLPCKVPSASGGPLNDFELYRDRQRVLLVLDIPTLKELKLRSLGTRPFNPGSVDSWGNLRVCFTLLSSAVMGAVLEQTASTRSVFPGMPVMLFTHLLLQSPMT